MSKRKTFAMIFLAALSSLLITGIAYFEGVGYPAAVWMCVFSGFFMGANTQDLLDKWK